MVMLLCHHCDVIMQHAAAEKDYGAFFYFMDFLGSARDSVFPPVPSQPVAMAILLLCPLMLRLAAFCLLIGQWGQSGVHQ